MVEDDDDEEEELVEVVAGSGEELVEPEERTPHTACLQKSYIAMF